MAWVDLYILGTKSSALGHVKNRSEHQILASATSTI